MHLLRLTSTVTATLMASASVVGAWISRAPRRQGVQTVHANVLHLILTGGQGVKTIIELNGRLVVFLAKSPELTFWVLRSAWVGVNLPLSTALSSAQDSKGLCCFFSCWNQQLALSVRHFRSSSRQSSEDRQGSWAWVSNKSMK